MIDINRGEIMNDLLNKLKLIEEVEPLDDEREAILKADKSERLSDKVIKADLKEREDSDKFILRLPKSIGAKLRREAASEGVSLNQYILTATAYYLGHKEA